MSTILALECHQDTSFSATRLCLAKGPSYTECGIISSCVSLEHPIPSLWSSGIHTHDVFSGTLRVNPG